MITDEVAVAKRLIDGTFDEKINKYTALRILAKYYTHVENLGEDLAKKKLDQYMGTIEEKYVWEMNDSNLRSIIRKIKDSPPIKIEPVEIYESEIETIRKIKDLTKEKLLFSYLIHAKIRHQINSNSNGWVYDDSKIIFDSVSISRNLKRRNEIIFGFVSNGYLNISESINNQGVQINYMSLTGKIFCVIDNFNQLDLQYEKLMGVSDFIKCVECDTLARKKNNKMTRCKECAVVVYEQQSREKALRYYHKVKTLPNRKS